MIESCVIINNNTVTYRNHLYCEKQSIRLGIQSIFGIGYLMANFYSHSWAILLAEGKLCRLYSHWESLLCLCILLVYIISKKLSCLQRRSWARFSVAACILLGSYIHAISVLDCLEIEFQSKVGLSGNFTLIQGNCRNDFLLFPLLSTTMELLYRYSTLSAKRNSIYSITLLLNLVSCICTLR